MSGIYFDGDIQIANFPDNPGAEWKVVITHEAEDGGAKRGIYVVSHELDAAMEIAAGQLRELMEEAS